MFFVDPLITGWFITLSKYFSAPQWIKWNYSTQIINPTKNQGYSITHSWFVWWATKYAPQIRQLLDLQSIFPILRAYASGMTYQLVEHGFSTMETMDGLTIQNDDLSEKKSIQPYTKNLEEGRNARSFSLSKSKSSRFMLWSLHAELVSLHSSCLCTTLHLSGVEVLLRRKKHRHGAVWVRDQVGEWFDRITFLSKSSLYTV